jgi:hypothetical protein
MSKYFGRLTAHPSITGWKTAPHASGADDAASVLFPDSGGIMLSGVAELSVFSIQMEIRPKRNVATRLLAQSSCAPLVRRRTRMS